MNQHNARRSHGVPRRRPKKRRTIMMTRRQAASAAFQAVSAAGILPAQVSTPNELWVNPAAGADAGSGTRASPLRTLAEAVRRVNRSTGDGSMTIVLTEGVHVIQETTTLKPERRSFTRAARLTIRAEVLPDDADWNIGRMPALIHAMPLPPTWNGRPDPLGGAANGMLVETSHVSVQGLKILGLPVVETPKPGMKRRLYAIARLDRKLEDLEVAQCLFAGDEIVAPNHVGIIAQGDGLVVHHCLFRGFMKDAVVYWTPGSTGHAMRNCFFHGMYGSTIWTAGVAGDLDYRNNIADSARYVWIYQAGAAAQSDAGGGRARLPAESPQERTHYQVVDSLFAHNTRLAGTGTGARIEFADIDPSFLELSGARVIEQAVMVELDETKRSYLHPVAGSEAAKIGAGLFMKAGA
ncbi:MAG: hypothetical protein KGN36_05185 [Acidobacteriota bacterium]|nr:hypothetical protein [Acidobacteriota bacterium]